MEAVEDPVLAAVVAETDQDLVEPAQDLGLALDGAFLTTHHENTSCQSSIPLPPNLPPADGNWAETFSVVGHTEAGVHFRTLHR